MSSLAEPLPACFLAGRLEAGTDEAGRGCLAGPVFAGAVILPDSFSHPWLNDSKQLSEARRMALREIIMKEAVAWAVASCSAAEIDSMNILNASIEAMHRALAALNPEPGGVIVDGNRFRQWRAVDCRTFVKGDGRFANIAAASVLAKTERDLYMEALAKDFPQYGWEINKGYPTAVHREAIRLYGPTPHHRMSFRLIPEPSLFD